LDMAASFSQRLIDTARYFDVSGRECQSQSMPDPKLDSSILIIEKRFGML